MKHLSLSGQPVSSDSFAFLQYNQTACNGSHTHIVTYNFKSILLKHCSHFIVKIIVHQRPRDGNENKYVFSRDINDCIMFVMTLLPVADCPTFLPQLRKDNYFVAIII